MQSSQTAVNHTSIPEIHQQCMVHMQMYGLVPGNNPGGVGGSMEAFREREAHLVNQVLMNHVPGIDNRNGVELAAIDLSTCLRGAGINAGYGDLIALHESVVSQALGLAPQIPMHAPASLAAEPPREGLLGAAQQLYARGDAMLAEGSGKSWENKVTAAQGALHSVPTR